jgi:hypothetical protein
MSTQPRPPIPAEIELAKTQAELRSVIRETEGLFIDLRRVLGFPARAAVAPARHRKGLKASASLQARS